MDDFFRLRLIVACCERRVATIITACTHFFLLSVIDVAHTSARLFLCVLCTRKGREGRVVLKRCRVIDDRKQPASIGYAERMCGAFGG